MIDSLDSSGTARPPRSRGHWSIRLLRWIVPVLALGYLLTLVSVEQLLASLAAIPVSALALTVLTWVAAGMVATLRWALVFRACGTAPPAPFLELFRLHWIGGFYNMYMPGHIGGDVVRGMATRSVDGSTPRALAIVLLERVLGFAAMLFVVGMCWVLFPVPGIPGLGFWSALGLCVAVGSGVSIVSAARLAPYLPPRLARIAASLPRVQSLPLFGVVFGLSVLIQISGVVAGHVLVASLYGGLSFRDSLVIVPLINALQYFPLTVGGAGVREAGFVVLFGGAGVPASSALAASLGLGMLQYLVSALGGLLQWVPPIGLRNGASES